MTTDPQGLPNIPYYLTVVASWLINFGVIILLSGTYSKIIHIFPIIKLRTAALWGLAVGLITWVYLLIPMGGIILPNYMLGFHPIYQFLPKLILILFALGLLSLIASDIPNSIKYGGKNNPRRHLKNPENKK